MSDLYSAVAALRRPPLLVRAARAGLMDYDRERDLKRILRLAAAPGPARSVERLLEEEERIDDLRRQGDGSYSFLRHIEVLIALMAEASILGTQ